MGMKHYTISAFAVAMALTAQAQNTPQSQMEKLDRGLVAAKSGTNIFISWRFLGTDDEERTTFDVLKNGNQIGSSTTDMYKTNCTVSGSINDVFQVVTKIDGTAVDTTAAVKPWDKPYLYLPLDKPAPGENSGTAYNYTPNDCSVGDVDGDGQYEIILKWEPSTAKDNSQSGYTGNVILDCYKLGGTKLWRIDLGRNIRAGAHYTQFLVYDFDGDGKAELICKTAPGSIDGTGEYVNQAATDATIKGHNNLLKYANSSGYILSGPEYLTVFNGETGKAVHTIWYNPNRAGTLNQEGTNPDKSFWGDNYGNRSDRFLACVAYLDGQDKNPSAVMSRGYYTRAYLWAVDFDGTNLKTKWLHGSTSKNQMEIYDANFKRTTKIATKNTAGTTKSYTMYANGNHNMSVADVDGDGCDEIIWGSAALDNNGTLLYATGYGHGDAIHMSDLDPDRPGLEVFQVHEESDYGWDVHDAATGEILHSATGGSDNGRGMAAQLSKNARGFWFSSSNDRQQRSAATGLAESTKSGSLNFRMYWDGTLQDALLDGNTLDKYNDTSGSFGRLATFYSLGPGSTCNSTKKTPNLSADILGDWREELILWDSSDSAHLAVYTTAIATEYRMPTLMHDHTYRMGVAWQNAAYNQPPHLGYYLPDAMLPRLLNKEKKLTVNVGDSVFYDTKMRYTRGAMLTQSSAPDGTTKKYLMIDGFSRTINTTEKTLALGGKASMAGDYQFIFKLTGHGGEAVFDTITVHAVEANAINDITAPDGDGEWVGIDIDENIDLTFALNGNKTVEITLYDAGGRKILARTAKAANGARISIPACTTGTQLLKIETDDRCITKKFVK